MVEVCNALRGYAAVRRCAAIVPRMRCFIGEGRPEPINLNSCRRDMSLPRATSRTAGIEALPSAGVYSSAGKHRIQSQLEG